MAKFNKATVKPQTFSPVTSAGVGGKTFEGATGYSRDAKSELFLLAVSNFVAEDSFYENASSRDRRFEDLVRTVASTDPGWLMQFIPWLRNEAGMRSASLVAAAVTAKRLLELKTPGGRKVIDAAIGRADEPGEFLAYWMSQYGRKLPKPVKRGVADAAARLYTERNLLKWDSVEKGVRFGDVLELCHPDPKAPWQNRLFKYAIDRRHDRAVADDGLPMIQANAALRASVKLGRYEQLLRSDLLGVAGFTWEDALSLGGSHLDKKALWEAAIPSMGLMALVRNLRNFDEAGVSDKVAQIVTAKLTDANEVTKSKMFPFRFLSAYKQAPSLRWAYPLETALSLSLGNVPVLKGRTLILVDTSGSMDDRFTAKSEFRRWEQAALFGIAVASRCEDATMVSFSSTSMQFPLAQGESILKGLNRFRNGYFFGAGTDTALAVAHWYAKHDRVLILTDEQAHYGYGHSVDVAVPATVPMYTWNLAGYQLGHTPSGKDNRHTFGGLSDRAFKMIPLLEAGVSADWGTVFGTPLA